MKRRPGSGPRRWQGALKRWRHSIKGRVLLLFVLLALGTAGLFLVGLQRLLQTGWQSYARPMVVDYVDRLAADIGSPPDAARARALATRLPIRVRIDGPLLQLDTAADADVDADVDVDQRRDRWRGFRNDAHDAQDAQADPHKPDSDFSLTRLSADGHRIRFALAAPPDSQRPRLIGWATLAALLLLTGAAYFSMARLLRPLRAIGAGVEAYGQGRFDVPIAVRRDDELGDLSRRINAMAASLGGMLDAKRALLLAMSHELRSPLTRARINTELLDDSPERAALLLDLNEMAELISTLLEGERLSAASSTASSASTASGHSVLQAEPTDLPALLRTAAAAHGAPLHVQIDETIGHVTVDPTRVRLLLRNLLSNAARHAADAAEPPLLYLQREAEGHIALGLRDHGPGVPADVLPLLADAFYRPDAARTRQRGGVGLGLHLCRLVAQAHGGALRIRNAGAGHAGLDVAMVWVPAR